MRKRNGFTLVELLAVIVILALIMIIVIPAVLNTLTTARRKTFGEYVTKVYDVALKKYLADELNGNATGYVRYDITKDLDLNNTGNYKGYVVIIKNDNSTDVYIGMSDDDYHTATQLNDNSASVVNYINYNVGGEPKYANPLVKFDGKSNSFTNGKVDDFGLPEVEDKEDLVTLKVDTTPEEDFESLLKDFHNKAKKLFNDNKDKGNGIVLAEPLQVSKLDSNSQVIGVETIGTKYYSAISYKSIYGESEKNNGYVIIVQLSIDDIENKEADDILSTAFNNYKLEQLALTNDEYHTVTYVSERNRDPSTGNYVNSEYNAPFMVTYTFADENPYFEPKYTTQLEVKNLFGFIDYNKIGNKALEICERNGYPNCTNYKPTKEDNLEVVQYAKEDFKKIMPSYQKYVSKDFNDELSKNDYDLEYLTSEGKDVFPTINIDVYDYGN